MPTFNSYLRRWPCALSTLIALTALGCSGADDSGSARDRERPGESPGKPGSDPDQDTLEPGQQPSAAQTKTDPCYTPEQSFAWEMYGSVFSRCIGCHNSFGLARQVGVALKFTFPGEPDFAAKNVTLLSSYAASRIDVNGESVPLLLAKPTQRVAHVGGEVLAPNGPEAKLLASFVDKLVNPPHCKDVPPDAAEVALSGLALATPKQTYARAKFMLAGEVATPEELDGLPQDEAMLDKQLDQLMQTDAFMARVSEMFNDWLLTDAYSSIVRGDDLFPQLRDYPQRNYFLPLCTPERTNRCCDAAMGAACCASVETDANRCGDAVNDLAIDAVAREPLELLKYIVRHDMPLTELVTAEYTVANPYSAMVYGMTQAQRQAIFDTDPNNDATEFKPIQLAPTAQNGLRISGGAGYPHAGILSMPVVLVRFPSSTSNQERTRGARLILERFLGVPVMKLSDFSTAKLPPDADLELATQEYAACTVCHAAIDPIAGHFRNFGSTGQYRVSTKTKLAEHLPEPEFLGQKMPMGGDPLRWLGSQVAQHPRFGLGVLAPVFADLIGTEVLTAPSDLAAEDYRARYLAFRMQQIEIQRLRKEFSGPAGLRLKPLVKAIVKGPFFRAIGSNASDEITREGLALAGVGLGALLTPEQLARKIEQVAGITYRSGMSGTGRDLLRSFRDYRLMFGGTDWDSTPARYREPNAMSVRIAMRMGNELACSAVPQDFSIIDAGKRKLFRNVDLTTTPESGGEAAIKTEIKRLHSLVLGEQLADGDPELEATYQLWQQSHEALRTAAGSGKGGQNSATRSKINCKAIASFDAAQTPYPNDTHRVVDQDTNNTLKPWVAVLSYLLSDGRFFLQ
ncbi:MAG TPA: DUF1588 domain-containing protein [Polyangiales bacterium]|nr:DUF1588 domain-containing protein [Polyangiales bacterium]